jgi:hypothetical protein
MQQVEMAILTGRLRNNLQVLPEQVMVVALDPQVVQV